MEPIQQLGRLLLFAGAMFLLLGVLFYFGPKFPLRLGRLPGDISYRGEHSTFYFPIASCLLVSVAISLVLWLVNHFRR